jgi:N-hydroxyarylamine O-acetyltransferase
MNTRAYLERIKYVGLPSPTFETLRELQLAHLLTIPFENLSIQAREPIILQEDALFDKMIIHRRGGFCYELNALFTGLLRQLGFNVSMLSAGVVQPDGKFGRVEMSLMPVLPFPPMKLLNMSRPRMLALFCGYSGCLISHNP